METNSAIVVGRVASEAARRGGSYDHALARVRAALGAARLPVGVPDRVREIVDLVRARSRARSELNFELDVRMRLRQWLTGVYVAEIERRGGETEIEGEHDTTGLELRSRSRGLSLLHVETWRYYSRGFGSRRASLAYLCGRDDNGPWAVRVPGTCMTVDTALAWVEPRAVREAREQGWRVLRQGDVYAVESRTDAMHSAGSHCWDPESRTLVHEPAAGERPHAPLAVPFRARLVEQRVYRMGRSGRRGSGD